MYVRQRAIDIDARHPDVFIQFDRLPIAPGPIAARKVRALWKRRQADQPIRAAEGVDAHHPWPPEPRFVPRAGFFPRGGEALPGFSGASALVDARLPLRPS